MAVGDCLYWIKRIGLVTQNYQGGMHDLEKFDVPEAEREQWQYVDTNSNRVQVHPLAIDWPIIEEKVDEEDEEEAEALE